jgi:hypothetical protein
MCYSDYDLLKHSLSQRPNGVEPLKRQPDMVTQMTSIDNRMSTMEKQMALMEKQMTAMEGQLQVRESVQRNCND